MSIVVRLDSGSLVGPVVVIVTGSVCRPALQRQRTTVGEGNTTTTNRKPPAWDIKGRLEIMESKFR